jgi:cytochrome c-type biogenesis protein CcmF
MHLAHIGVAVFVIGVTLVKGYESEKDVRMAPGDTVAVGGYSVRLLGIKDATGPNYRAVVGELELARDGKVLRLLNPEKRKYFSSEMPMTEAAIDTGLFRDVYVSLGEPVGEKDGSGAWSVRVHHKPFVDWIWGGCLLMALGGLVAASDRRYRLKAKGVAS